MGQELGSGQFGLVLEGKFRETRVAVKMIREECMSDEDFKEEARVMMYVQFITLHCSVQAEWNNRNSSDNTCVCVCFNRRLSHCKLVQLYGVCTQGSPMCLLFEFMENGCLSDYLRARKGSLSQDVMLGMCLDVSEGMAYLESSNFIHRDLVRPCRN